MSECVMGSFTIVQTALILHTQPFPTLILIDSVLILDAYATFCHNV